MIILLCGFFFWEMGVYVLFVFIELKDAVNSDYTSYWLLCVHSSLVMSPVTVSLFQSICSFFNCYEGSNPTVWWKMWNDHVLLSKTVMLCHLIISHFCWPKQCISIRRGHHVSLEINSQQFHFILLDTFFVTTITSKYSLSNTEYQILMVRLPRLGDLFC